MNALKEDCLRLRDELVALRREFHRDPELGLHEYHTAARIERELDKCGIPHERIGGKTAVDLPTGKNQAGSFYQPCIVICDPNTLETLPEEQYRCGCAEIIKYSMLGNAAFFEELYKTPVREQYEHVIEVCVQMKRDIVGADEYDLGRRRTLNLGHTFGHAVEQCSDFSLLHGEAVAIGMATVTRAAVKRGICGEETLARLLDVLHRYGLPTETG